MYYVGNDFGIPQHFAKDYDLLFEQLRLLVLPELYCLLITHLSETEDNISLVDHFVLFFFVCPFYIRRTKYPTLEKPPAQNIVFENESKRRELSNH